MGRKNKGSYNVRHAQQQRSATQLPGGGAAAAASPTRKPVTPRKAERHRIQIIIRHLDQEEHTVWVSKTATGGEVLADFINSLGGTVDADYFGLYVPGTEPLVWMDTALKIKKQAKQKPIILEFGVRYYASDPRRLRSYTKYLHYLQLREDLACGALVCPRPDALKMAAAAMQAELGDFDAAQHSGAYMSGMVLLAAMHDADTEALPRLHQELRGLSGHEAEMLFLKIACSQEMYGVDLHKVQDMQREEVQLGICAQGIKVFGPLLRSQDRYIWPDIQSVSFKSKQFTIHLKSHAGVDMAKKGVYRCKSSQKARVLWKSAVQRHTFFRRKTGLNKIASVRGFLNVRRLSASPVARSGFFGRTESELEEEMKAKITVAESDGFQRVATLKRNGRSRASHRVRPPPAYISDEGTSQSPPRLPGVAGSGQSLVRDRPSFADSMDEAEAAISTPTVSATDILGAKVVDVADVVAVPRAPSVRRQKSFEEAIGGGLFGTPSAEDEMDIDALMSSPTKPSALGGRTSPRAPRIAFGSPDTSQVSQDFGGDVADMLAAIERERASQHEDVLMQRFALDDDPEHSGGRTSVASTIEPDHDLESKPLSRSSKLVQHSETAPGPGPSPLQTQGEVAGTRPVAAGVLTGRHRGEMRSTLNLMPETPIVAAVLGSTSAPAPVPVAAPVAVAAPAVPMSTDNFFVRSLFPFAQGLARGRGGDPAAMLAFDRDDVLRVKRHSPLADWWEAENVRTSETGFIPSPKWCEQHRDVMPDVDLNAITSADALDCPVPTDSPTKRSPLKKRSTMNHLNSTLYNQRNSMRESTVPQTRLPPYMAVRIHDASDFSQRPVIILGPSKDHVIDRLVADYPDLFRTCVPHTTRAPRDDEVNGLDYFFVSAAEMEEAISRGDFIETLRYQNSVYGTTYGAVEAASKQGGLCMLDISDPQTIGRLLEAGLHPISVFLRPASVEVVQMQNPQYERDAAQALCDLATVNEHLYSDKFTTVIENSDLEDTFAMTHEFLYSESQRPFWVHDEDAERYLALQAEAAVPAPGKTSFRDVTAGAVPNARRRQTGSQARASMADKAFVATELIKFSKAVTGLGFSFAGGRDNQYVPGDDNIYVTKLAPGGAADNDGRLQVGDKVVQANGKDFTRLTHAEAVAVLKANSEGVALKVVRRCFKVTLEPIDSRYGLGIRGGSDTGGLVSISRIQPGSAASTNPRLKIGHEITHVNGRPVRAMSHSEILSTIQESKTRLELVIHPRNTRALARSQSHSMRPMPHSLVSDSKLDDYGSAPSSPRRFDDSNVQFHLEGEPTSPLSNSPAPPTKAAAFSTFGAPLAAVAEPDAVSQFTGDSMRAVSAESEFAPPGHETAITLTSADEDTSARFDLGARLESRTSPGRPELSTTDVLAEFEPAPSAASGKTTGSSTGTLKSQPALPPRQQAASTADKKSRFFRPFSGSVRGKKQEARSSFDTMEDVDDILEQVVAKTKSPGFGEATERGTFGDIYTSGAGDPIVLTTTSATQEPATTPQAPLPTVAAAVSVVPTAVAPAAAKSAPFLSSPNRPFVAVPPPPPDAPSSPFAKFGTPFATQAASLVSEHPAQPAPPGPAPTVLRPAAVGSLDFAMGASFDDVDDLIAEDTSPSDTLAPAVPSEFMATTSFSDPGLLQAHTIAVPAEAGVVSSEDEFPEAPEAPAAIGSKHGETATTPAPEPVVPVAPVLAPKWEEARASVVAVEEQAAEASTAPVAVLPAAVTLDAADSSLFDPDETVALTAQSVTVHDVTTLTALPVVVESPEAVDVDTGDDSGGEGSTEDGADAQEPAHDGLAVQDVAVAEVEPEVNHESSDSVNGPPDEDILERTLDASVFNPNVTVAHHTERMMVSLATVAAQTVAVDQTIIEPEPEVEVEAEVEVEVAAGEAGVEAQHEASAAAPVPAVAAQEAVEDAATAAPGSAREEQGVDDAAAEARLAVRRSAIPRPRTPPHSPNPGSRSSSPVPATRSPKRGRASTAKVLTASSSLPKPRARKDRGRSPSPSPRASAPAVGSSPSRKPSGAAVSPRPKPGPKPRVAQKPKPMTPPKPKRVSRSSKLATHGTAPPPKPPLPARPSQEVLDTAVSSRVARLAAASATSKASSPAPASPKAKRQLYCGKFQGIPVYRKGFSRTKTCSDALLPESLPRNRYKDILPYNNTRVLLDGQDSDYVNANHIVCNLGKPGVHRYIATQGPLQETAEQFWQMAWQQKCPLICMLTDLVEGSRKKCHQYWPAAVGAAEQFGSLSCKLVSEDVQDGFIARTLELSQGDDARTVVQIQYCKWPDHGVPNESETFLAYVAEVQAWKRKLEQSGPLLVHCSAGIGRTGVYIVVELGFALLNAGLPVNLPIVVRRLREQRMGMVQTENQFMFCYSTLSFARCEQRVLEVVPSMDTTK